MSEQMMRSTPRAVTEEERPFWNTVARLYREYGTETTMKDCTACGGTGINTDPDARPDTPCSVCKGSGTR